MALGLFKALISGIKFSLSHQAFYDKYHQKKKGVVISSLFASPNLPVGIDMIESTEKWPNYDRREEMRKAGGAPGGRGGPERLSQSNAF